MTGRNFGWGDKSITTKWNFISKVDSKIYKSLKELINRYGTLFIFLFVVVWSHWVTLYKSCFCDPMSLCKWHFLGLNVTLWNILKQLWTTWFYISIRKLFKVQNLMADKIACRISLLHLFSSAKWFKEFNAVLKDKGSEKLIFQFKNNIYWLAYFCPTDCSEDNQELYYVFIIESSVHFRWDSSRQDHLSVSPSLPPSLPPSR